MAKIALTLLGAVLLSACLAPTPTLKPHTRPAGLVPKPPPAVPTTPSQDRLSLQEFFAGVQADHLARGLMRVDGGGPETQFDAETLVRNFGDIAFAGEHRVGANGLYRGASDALRRWRLPIRVGTTFGRSISADQRRKDAAYIAKYTARLSRVSGHPMSLAKPAAANFHVLVMSTDDHDELHATLRRIVPNASRATYALFESLPRSVHCLVWAQPSAADEMVFDSAIVLIRAEHPQLGRESCIHEEMAQGLGLIKDSPRARPSIFNDDDEFAYLTTHDEMLLKMLYDPRLSPGMSFEQARPIATTIAAELTGSNS